MRLWSPARLRNGVEEWEEITPEPLRKAVDALRRAFGESAWKISEIMRQGCHPALHRGMAHQARTIHEGIKKLGLPALPNVDQGQTESTVFTEHFKRCADLLAGEVRNTFSELYDVASAHPDLIESDPVDWASLQTRVLIADESHMIPLWTRSACDVQHYDPNDADELIYWTKWRAPKWFFMQPFANSPYYPSTAWERMAEEESKHVLEVVEDRFNHRLIMALKKAVDETHVRLARQASKSAPIPPHAVAELARQVPAQSASKGPEVNGQGYKADLWRDFHEKFQALGDEERKEGAGRRDRFVLAYFTYRKGAEIIHVRRDARWAFALFGGSNKLLAEPTVRNTASVAYGPFCLLETPECGLWTLSEGVSENFSERVQTLGARAGVALGCPSGTDPLDSWLHRLLCDLRENRTKLLCADNGEDGIIVRVCEASAIFCSRLERKTLEASVLVNLRDDRRRKPERGDPEVAKRRSLVRSNPNTPADELCAILDRENVPVPFKWQDAGFNQWTKAYKNREYRSRIDVLVSKDKTSD